MNNRTTLAAVIAALGCFSAPVMAAAGHAHEHGVADLTLVQYGDELQLNLVSPMANLVGFEGAADTPERKAALAKLQQQLNTPLITVSGCRVASFDAELPDMDDDHEEHDHEDHDHDHEDHDHDHEEHDHDHEDHDHDHEDHDHDHEDHGHDHEDHDHDHEDHDHDHEDHDHGHEEHDHGHEESAHSDLEASWSFTCESNADLVLTSKLFDSFPGISTLKLQWITDAGQGATSWTEDRKLELR